MSQCLAENVKAALSSHESPSGKKTMTGKVIKDEYNPLVAYLVEGLTELSHISLYARLPQLPVHYLECGHVETIDGRYFPTQRPWLQPGGWHFRVLPFTESPMIGR